MPRRSGPRLNKRKAELKDQGGAVPSTSETAHNKNTDKPTSRTATGTENCNLAVIPGENAQHTTKNARRDASTNGARKPCECTIATARPSQARNPSSMKHKEPGKYSIPTKEQSNCNHAPASQSNHWTRQTRNKYNQSTNTMKIRKTQRSGRAPDIVVGSRRCKRCRGNRQPRRP